MKKKEPWWKKKVVVQTGKERRAAENLMKFLSREKWRMEKR